MSAKSVRSFESFLKALEGFCEDGEVFGVDGGLKAHLDAMKTLPAAIAHAFSIGEYDEASFLCITLATKCGEARAEAIRREKSSLAL